MQRMQFPSSVSAVKTRSVFGKIELGRERNTEVSRDEEDGNAEASCAEEEESGRYYMSYSSSSLSMSGAILLVFLGRCVASR